MKYKLPLILALLFAKNIHAEQSNIIPVACIGSGCAALSLAMVTTEYGYKTVLFAGPQQGGDLNVKTEVGNWPGISFSFGNRIIPTLEQQAKKFGGEIIHETITAVDFSSKPYKLTSSSNQVYLAENVVIATGTRSRYLTIPGAKENRQHIFYNEDVHKNKQRFEQLVNGKKVAIMGGGIDAMKKAVYASKGKASKITMLVRANKLNLPPWRKRYLDKSQSIDIKYNVELSHISKINSGIRLHFIDKSFVDVDYLIVSIGRVARTELFSSKLELNDKKQIIVNPMNFQTNISDVYAVGDVTNISGPQPQAGIAAGDGMKAGYMLVEKLQKQNHPLTSAKVKNSFPQNFGFFRKMFRN
jgi:thioredoxin reductase (NADPH)